MSNSTKTVSPLRQRIIEGMTKRHCIRNHVLEMIMFWHGLRVSEAITIMFNDVDLNRSWLWVRRLKSGISVEQMIPGDELRSITRYLKHRADGLP